MRYSFAAFIALLYSVSTFGQISFSEESTEYGLSYQGRTYGSSWGDFNGDGYYDLFLSCHYHIAEPFFNNDFPRLYLNLEGDALDPDVYSFDVADQADLHGGLFFDYDNDGDKDLLISTGGTKRNLFYQNSGNNELVDSALDLNLGLDLGRGRQATCFDADQDGFLDLFFNNEIPRTEGQPNSELLIKNFGGGYEIAENFQLHEAHSDCSFISDMDGDGRSELIVLKTDSIKIFSQNSQNAFELEGVIEYPNMRDLVVADFDGDLLSDIFIARGRKTSSDVGLLDDHTVLAGKRLSPDRPAVGATIQFEGDFEATLYPATPFPFTLHLGSEIVIEDLNDIYTINLSATDPDNFGFQELDDANEGVHVYIGLIETGEWKVISFSYTESNRRLNMLLRTDEVITNLDPTGLVPLNNAVRDLMLLNQGDFDFAEVDHPAFTLDHNSLNATSGDYDNDGDMDIYVLSTDQVINKPNYTYENLGNGTFSVQPDGWNTFGASNGVGDACTTGDINNDGFLDLLVTNGSLAHFLDSASQNLFVNQGNGNNWVKIQLEGVESNRDGIGAKVYTTSNGITQLRETTGGIHTSSQDDSRLHFGLGLADEIEQLQVQWPSGIVDQLTEVEVNEIHTIVEGSFPLSTMNASYTGSITIFPNPSSDGMLSIKFSESKLRQITIIDPLGKSVAQESFSGSQYFGNFNDLKSGLYLIEIRDIDGSLIETKKWIKY